MLLSCFPLCNNVGTMYGLSTFIFFIFQLTWADLVLQSALEMFVNGHGMMPEYQNPDALKNHESVADYKKKIENLPNLKAWIEKRPNTPF